MTLSVKQGGTWKTVTALFVKQGGTWKPVLSGTRKTGSVWSQFYAQASGGSSGAIVSPFTAWNVTNDTQATGSTVSTSLTIANNGAVLTTGQTVDGVNGSSNWYSPNASGVGAGYYVKFTPTTGTFTANSAAGFTSLASSQTVTCNIGTTGSKSVTFTIQIATDAAGTNIVFTSTGNQLVAAHGG